MVAAKIANLPEGRPSAENASRDAFSQSNAAAQLDVGHRSVHAHVGLKRTVRTPKKKGQAREDSPLLFLQ
jgi:hypothetical protein